MRKFETLQKDESRAQSADCLKAGVPNLGYMYPQGYICLSEGVHLRLAIEEKIYLHNICFQIFIHISVNIIFKNHCMLVVKYIYE